MQFSWENEMQPIPHACLHPGELWAAITHHAFSSLPSHRRPEAPVPITSTRAAHLRTEMILKNSHLSTYSVLECLTELSVLAMQALSSGGECTTLLGSPLRQRDNFQGSSEVRPLVPLTMTLSLQAHSSWQPAA